MLPLCFLFLFFVMFQMCICRRLLPRPSVGTQLQEEVKQHLQQLSSTFRLSFTSFFRACSYYCELIIMVVFIYIIYVLLLFSFLVFSCACCPKKLIHCCFSVSD